MTDHFSAIKRKCQSLAHKSNQLHWSKWIFSSTDWSPWPRPQSMQYIKKERGMAITFMALANHFRQFKSVSVGMWARLFLWVKMDPPFSKHDLLVKEPWPTTHHDTPNKAMLLTVQTSFDSWSMPKSCIWAGQFNGSKWIPSWTSKSFWSKWNCRKH